MKQRRFGGIFWRLVASYAVATFTVALIGTFVGRFDGPFGVFRDSVIVDFFNRLGDNSTNSAVLFVLLAGLVGLLTGLLASGNLTRRLAHIATAADAWSRGELTAVARVSGNDELGQLARDLNQMAAQIQILFAAQQALAIVEERNRLARDLHDTVKQHVFANALLIRATRKQLPRDPAIALKHLEDAEALSVQTQAELTALIRALRPSSLADKGLADMLRSWTGEWAQQMGIAVDLRVQGERETPLAVEDALFRVIQEALANVARHSDAPDVLVSLTWEPARLHLRVQDHGRGFDATRTMSKGMGLRSMRERIEDMHGQFAIASSAAGTTIDASVPMQPSEEVPDA